MISSISGTVLSKRAKYMVIEAGGIGYRIFTTPNTSADAKVGENIKLFTYLAVRETSMELFGFSSEDELDFFELLIGISGIGPKGALGVLSTAGVSTLTSAISSGDTSYLTKVSGIGKKNAEKIVLELQDKIGSISAEVGTSLKEEAEALEALKSLGYSHADSRDILKKISKTTTTAGEMVREALKLLGS